MGVGADGNLCAQEMRAEPLLAHKAPSNEALVAHLQPHHTLCLASPGRAGPARGSCRVPLPELTPHRPQQQRLHLSPCPPWPSIPCHAGGRAGALSCAESEAAEMGKFAS